MYHLAYNASTFYLWSMLPCFLQEGLTLLAFALPVPQADMIELLLASNSDLKAKDAKVSHKKINLQSCLDKDKCHRTSFARAACNGLSVCRV